MKILREEKKLSQPELADALGVNKGTISYWENDLKEPTAPNIVKIAKFFAVTTDYLLGLEND